MAVFGVGEEVCTSFGDGGFGCWDDVGDENLGAGEFDSMDGAGAEYLGPEESRVEVTTRNLGLG